MTTVWAPVHPQVTASNGVEVDAGIAPLLEVLWRRGFETDFSCQGGQDQDAHIGFTTAAGARMFAAQHSWCFLDARWVFFPATHIGELTEAWSRETRGVTP